MVGHCVSCEGALVTSGMPYRYGKGKFQTLLPGLAILVCTECGLRQVDHARIDRAALDAYYISAYRPVGKRHRLDTLDVNFQARGRAFAQLARRYAGPSKVRSIYELGAGLGYNLIALGQAFPEAGLYASEADSTAELPSSITPCRLEERRYDIVLLSHVLEHLIHPAAWLGDIDAALEPGGLLIIEVPNDTEAFLRAKPEDQPHITFFERDNLAALIRRHLPDYEIVHLATAGPQRIHKGPAQTVPGFKARLADALARRLPPAFAVLRGYSRLKQRLTLRRRLDGAVRDLLNDTPDGDRQHLRLIARKTGTGK